MSVAYETDPKFIVGDTVSMDSDRGYGYIDQYATGTIVSVLPSLSGCLPTYSVRMDLPGDPVWTVVEHRLGTSIVQELINWVKED